MNDRILFSPIGGTDPISIYNGYEGAMLHIARYYCPTKIILYMTAEIYECHLKDNRYIYCLDKLYESLGKEYSYEIIHRDDLCDVQDFDYFYHELKSILTDIVSQMDDTDELLVNISSGTPAMKSGLVVVKTMGDINCKMVQVSTPEKKMNNHIHKNCDISELWECNLDNIDSVNRCSEIVCSNLLKLKNEEIIKKLISNYNYSGALEVAKSMTESNDSEYVRLLEIAHRRSLIDLNSVSNLSKAENVQFLPVRNPQYATFFEYALNLDIKLKNKMYADFVRGLTPLIVELYIFLIRENIKINIDDLCQDNIAKRNMGRKWDEGKMLSNPISKKWIERWNEAYSSKGKGKFKFEYVSSNDLLDIIDVDLPSSLDMLTVRKTAAELRRVEERIRNTAAHEISSINPKRIQNATGFSAEEIMKKIKDLIKYTGIDTSIADWNSYDHMNEYIISKM